MNIKVSERIEKTFTAVLIIEKKKFRKEKVYPELIRAVVEKMAKSTVTGPEWTVTSVCPTVFDVMPAHGFDDINEIIVSGTMKVTLEHSPRKSDEW